MNVGLLPNLDKAEASRLTRNVADWLVERGVTPVSLPEDAAKLAGSCEAMPIAEWNGRVKFALSMGSDGTLLKAARLLAPQGVPLLGVNLGRLGFLTEVEGENVFDVLPEFLAGHFVADRRIMLEAAVQRKDGSERRFLALNDVVITPGPSTRLGRLAIYVSGSHLGTYPADGVIVATPTGSTAYSLAAGGPLVSPDLDVLIITPICPHTFQARPTVVSKQETVLVRVERTQEGAIVTMDGQERCPLTGDEEVYVRAATVEACLMRRPGWDFYGVLRRKLSEGGQK